MMKWIFLVLVVGSTVMSDLLQSFEMKRQGAVEDFRPGALAQVFATVLRRKFMILAVAAMAVSFFSFLQLLAITDFSFAVPATAAAYVVETFLAKIVLKEDVVWQRWAGAVLVAGGVMLLSV